MGNHRGGGENAETAQRLERLCADLCVLRASAVKGNRKPESVNVLDGLEKIHAHERALLLAAMEQDSRVYAQAIQSIELGDEPSLRSRLGKHK